MAPETLRAWLLDRIRREIEAGDGAQAPAQPIDRLVVQRVDPAALQAHHRVKPAVRQDGDALARQHGALARQAAVGGVDVRVQRAAAVDVEHLRAAADAEDGAAGVPAPFDPPAVRVGPERVEGAELLANRRERELTRLNTQLESAREEYERERRREDVYTAEWQRYRQSLADTLRNYRSLQRTLQSLEAELAQAQYWIDGFKSVRLFLVEECVHFLEVETNNALTHLGLLDWRVRFDLQRETKDGAISKGFSVMIYSPNNAKEVPWEVWAGGETQRLRLAGALALSSLILNVKGTSSNILLVDEPSAHLDADGMADTLDALQHYAQHTRKQIWLVDHRSLDYGNFKDTVVVEKDAEHGSAIASGVAEAA